MLRESQRLASLIPLLFGKHTLLDPKSPRPLASRRLAMHGLQPSNRAHYRRPTRSSSQLWNRWFRCLGRIPSSTLCPVRTWRAGISTFATTGPPRPRSRISKAMWARKAASSIGQLPQAFTRRAITLPWHVSYSLRERRARRKLVSKHMTMSGSRRTSHRATLKSYPQTPNGRRLSDSIPGHARQKLGNS